METKQQLKEVAKRLEKAFSIYDYDFVIATDTVTCVVEMEFSSSTNIISPTAVDAFRRAVGDVGIDLRDNHLVLFGYPILY